jgi:hypothetical protein
VEFFRPGRIATGDEYPPFRCDCGRQPGFSLRESFQGAPTSGPPLGAVAFANPLFAGNQPAKEGLKSEPSLLLGATAAMFAPRNRWMSAVPNLDPVVFPWHRITTGPPEAGRATALHAAPDQGIPLWMAYIMTPQHHLLGQAAGCIPQQNIGHSVRLKHTPGIISCSSVARKTVLLLHFFCV